MIEKLLIDNGQTWQEGGGDRGDNLDSKQIGGNLYKYCVFWLAQGLPVL